MRYWWELPCQMAQNANGDTMVIDWETGGAIKINLAVHGWYPPPFPLAELGSCRPFDSVAATFRILLPVTLPDDTKRRW